MHKLFDRDPIGTLGPNGFAVFEDNRPLLAYANCLTYFTVRNFQPVAVRGGDNTSPQILLRHLMHGAPTIRDPNAIP